MKKQSLFKKNIQKIKEETIYEQGFPNAIKIEIEKQNIQIPQNPISQDNKVEESSIEQKKKVKVSLQEYSQIDQENKNFMKSLKQEEIQKFQEEIKGMFEPHVLQKFKKESFFELQEEMEKEQEKQKEEKIDEFLKNNNHSNSIDIPLQLLTYETQIQMICFDTKGKILEQESKDNKLKDLSLYEPGKDYFNLQILENMLYYDQQFQVNLAGLNLLLNFLDRINEYKNDLIYEDELKIYRVHILEYLEKKMLVCFRLCDFLRSKNVNIIAGSLNCLLRYLQVLIGDDLKFYSQTHQKFKQDDKLQSLVSLFNDMMIFDNLKQIEKYYINLEIQIIQEFYDISTKISLNILFLDIDQSLIKQFINHEMMLIVNKSSNQKDIQILQNLLQNVQIDILEIEENVIKNFDLEKIECFSNALSRQVDANFPFFMIKILKQIIPKSHLNQYKQNKDLKQQLCIFQVDLDNLFEILISIKLQNMQKYLKSERKKVNYLFDFLSIYFQDFLECFDFQILPFNTYKIMMILKILKQQVEVVLEQNSVTQSIHQHIFKSDSNGFQIGLTHIIGNLQQIKKINFLILESFKIFYNKKEPDFFMSLDEIILDNYFSTLLNLSNKNELANLVNLNPEIVDKLINAYQYNSYGNKIFTKVIFFFLCNSFPTKLRKRILSNLVVQYAYSFYDALKNGPYGSIQSYIMQEKEFKDCSEEILTILNQEGNIEDSFLIDFLVQFQ